MGNMNLGESGTRRLIESLRFNKNLETLDIGVIADSGLLNLSLFVTETESLRNLRFQEAGDTEWSLEAKRTFYRAMQGNNSLQTVQIETERH